MDYASSSRGSAVPERDLPTRARRDRTRHVRAVLDCDLTSRQFDSVGHKSSPVILSELEGRLFRPPLWGSICWPQTYHRVRGQDSEGKRCASIYPESDRP